MFFFLWSDPWSDPRSDPWSDPWSDPRSDPWSGPWSDPWSGPVRSDPGFGDAVTRCLIRRLLFKTSLAVSLNEHWTKIYFPQHMFLPEQFYLGYLPGLLTTGDNEKTSRWEILHRKITRPWRGKLLGLGGSPSFRALLALRISRAHFFLAVFFRVTHDGLSERGTTRSLQSIKDGF